MFASLGSSQPAAASNTSNAFAADDPFASIVSGSAVGGSVKATPAPSFKPAPATSGSGSGWAVDDDISFPAMGGSNQPAKPAASSAGGFNFGASG